MQNSAFFRGWLLACLLSGLFLPQHTVRSQDLFAQSANGNFKARIESNDSQQPLITVFQEKEGKEHNVWTRLLPDNHCFGSDPQDWPRNTSILIGDNGSVIVVRQNDRLDKSLTAFRIITQNGQDKKIRYSDVESLFPNEDSQTFEYTSEPLGAVFDLMVERSDSPFYACWSSRFRKWLVIDTNSFQATLASSAQLPAIAQIALPLARALVGGNEERPLSTILDPVRKKAAEFIPGLRRHQHSVNIWDDRTEAAYSLLANAKNPEDKVLIQRLLESDPGEFGVRHVSGSFGHRTGRLSTARALGDRLLAEWEGKTIEDEDAPIGNRDFVFEDSKLHYLGGFGGYIHLPVPPPEKTTSLLVYLIPGHVAKDAWKNSSAVMDLEIDLRQNSIILPGSDDRIKGTAVSFAFDTLTPGEYRLKAVWDRRPPFGERKFGRQRVTAEPGDYESSETEPITVKAGERLTRIDLHCTNRVGEAANYYAADETLKAQNPAEEWEVIQNHQPFSSDEVLFTAPLPEWQVQTNRNKGQIRFVGVQLVENDFGMGPQRRQLKFTVRTPPRPEESFTHYSASLIDDHGCRWDSSSSSMQNTKIEFFFSIIPFDSKELQLCVANDSIRPAFEEEEGEDSGESEEAEENKEKYAAIFTMKNLLKGAPADWKASPLPARKQFDSVTVELTQFKPGERSDVMHRYLTAMRGSSVPDFSEMMSAGSGAETDYHFYEAEKPLTFWRKVRETYSDRWGNTSPSTADFCKKENTIKVSAQFLRDPEKGVFSSEEKWVVRAPRAPLPGESLSFAHTNQLQGIAISLYSLGGSGQYTYDGSELVSSTNALPDNGFHIQRFLLKGSLARPKLTVTGGQGIPGYLGFGGAPRQRPSMTVTARIPYLVCRFSKIPDDTLVTLLEEDFSVSDTAGYGGSGCVVPSFTARPTIKFLPLDFRGGETNQQLTFIVQKLRTAEFIVNLPKE